MPEKNPKDPSAKPGRRMQHERREEAEGRLLKSALSLAARKGVNGMTMSEVGEQAGYSRGLPAHHFGSKGQLLRELAEFIRTQFRQSQRRPPDKDDGLDVLLGAINVYLIGTLSDERPTRALTSMFAEALVTGGELHAAMQDFNRGSLRFFERQIVAGIAKGEIRADVDPALQAHLILGTLRGAINQYLIEPAALDMRALREELVRSLRRSLVNPPQT